MRKHDEDRLEMTAETITMMTTEELTATQRSSVIDVCVAAHQNDAFRDLFAHIPSGRHFIASRGAEVVSHAVVTTRWAQPEGRRALRTAFVDAVATLPKFQGRGYATAVLRHLAAHIDDYELACLRTDIAQFYERLGWEVWPGPLAGRSADGLVPTPHQRGVMVLRRERTPPLDLHTLLTIECQPERIWE
jgi:aminoglycoside 2'-N-acetyltransferase I